MTPTPAVEEVAASVEAGAGFTAAACVLSASVAAGCMPGVSHGQRIR
jgi:hypothetical protein